MNHKTEQEDFWAGSFGDEYALRNRGQSIIASNTALFTSVLRKATGVESVLELGANIGLNLQALRGLLPDAELSGLEINPSAFEKLESVERVKAYNGSILDFSIDYKRSLVFTKGVLIHINPNSLSDVYKTMYEASSRYICVAEYYNPTPIEIPYRGHSGKLFKRDFAGELMSMYDQLELVDYGFVYHRDSLFALDDITWFLLRK